jgi:pimeloyl-ACP methyl ester carboxylesterase
MQTLKISARVVFFSAFALAAIALLGRAGAQETHRQDATPASNATAAKGFPSPPLQIAREGYVFAGGKYSSVNGPEMMSGQIYAEFQIPAVRKHRYPILMIHGGNQTGTNFTGTPDGREGWAQFFLRRGYAVYVMDQAGRGRSAYHAGIYGPAAPPDLLSTQKRFTAIERYNLWPQAHLHTQWPGAGVPGDPVFDQFFASQVPAIVDYEAQQRLSNDAIIALLDKIGPAILLTHSQSGPLGWLAADARPALVKAVVAVEPNGPPFFNVDNVGAPEWFREAPEKQRPWGITAVPLHYSPDTGNAADLEIARQDKPDGADLSRCWLQKNPARQLPNLRKMPILILTSESSYHAAYDHCTVKYLEQAGVNPKWVRLPDAGIHGNGHMMMLEKNNGEIAALMSRWLDGAISGASR